MQLTEANDTPAIRPEDRDRSKDIKTRAQMREQYRVRLQEHAQQRQIRLKEYLRGKRLYFRSLDEIPRRKRAEDTDLICRYYNGDQYGYYDNLGLYKDDRAEGDFAYAIPVLAGHVEQGFVQIFKVHPEYTANQDDGEDPTMQLVANMCEKLGVKELDRALGKIAKTEIYNMLLAGESARIVGWEPHKTSPRIAKRPKMETKDIELPEYRECEDCKTTLKADDEACTKCGSSNIHISPGGKTQNTSLSGYDEVELGENCVHVPHMLAMQRDMSAVEPEDSAFVVEYSYMDKHAAEWTFQAQIEESQLPLPIEMQMRFDLERGSTQIDALIGSARLAPPGREAAFGAGPGGSLAALNRKQPVEWHYWDPSEYGQFIPFVDEMLPEPLDDGRDKIPAGVAMGDFFPKGVKVLFVGDTLMVMKPCVRRKKMVIIRYGRIAGTNAGAGLKRLMPLQDAENDNFNLSQTIKHTVGHPLTAILGQFVDQLPGAGNVLKITNPALDDVGKAIRQWPGQPMDNRDGAQVMIEGAMQFIAGTNTVGGSGAVGAPDMRAAGTATGIAAMQEQAASRQSGPVDDRIQADIETLYQLLENIQEYSAPEQIEILNKWFGPDVVKRFMETNLRQEITWKIKPNTEMPRSMALNQANYIAFGQAIGQVLPVAAQFPWVMEYISDLATAMGFPFNVGEGRNDRREAQYRLNLLNDIEQDISAEQPQLAANPVSLAAAMHAKLAEVAGPFVMSDDELTGVLQNAQMQAPLEITMPRILMQHHPTFQDVYKDWLFGEQAKSASQARRLCVIQLWIDHKKAEASQQLILAQMQAAVNQTIEPPEQPDAPPPPEPSPDEEAAAQSAVDNEDFERERQMKEEDHARAKELSDHEFQRNEAAKDSEFMRQKALNDQQAEQQAQMQEQQAQQQAQLQAMKPNGTQ